MTNKTILHSYIVIWNLNDEPSFYINAKNDNQIIFHTKQFKNKRVYSEELYKERDEN